LNGKKREAYRQAIEALNERWLEMKATEAARKRAEREYRKVMRRLARVVRFSPAQEEELRRVEDAHDAAVDTHRRARDAWLEAIDRMLTAAERG
jgi:hypothetical protein